MAGTYSRRVWVTIAVLAHLIVTLLHGQAHTRLGVGLSDWQNALRQLRQDVLFGQLVRPSLR